MALGELTQPGTEYVVADALGVVDDAITNGDYTTTNLYKNRLGDIGSCSSLADALSTFQDLRDEAREVQDLWDYLTKGNGPVAPDLAAYFSCDNSVFSSESWCSNH